MRALRDVFLLAVSAAVSWFFLLHEPEEPTTPPAATPSTIVELAVAPSIESPPPSSPAEEPPTQTVDEPSPAPEPPAPEAPAPETPSSPPPEVGAPEGVEEVESPIPEVTAPELPDEPPAPSEEDLRRAEADRLRREIRELSQSEELLREAKLEVSGESRRGFRTVFLCAGRDQLEIAGFFGEPLVLVPRAGLDPERPHFFRLESGSSPRIVRVDEAAPLGGFRQYRDLFAFPYDSLPESVRRLRRSVLDRHEVYLFAALIPPAEWAVVIARREAALSEYNRLHRGRPRAMKDVRRVTMRYARLPGGGFDVRVTQILFSDGTHWTKERKT